MIMPEMRGLISVVVVSIIIGVLFVRIANYGTDETSASAEVARVTPTSTSTTSTTTTVPEGPQISDALGSIGLLCNRAQEFIDGTESEIVYPGKVPQLAEEFYAESIDYALAQVTREYEAALRYFTEFNELALPHGYDPLTILRSDAGERWGLLATGEPPGVAATRANVAFLCEGMEIPPPPLMSDSEFDRLRDIVRKENK